MQNIKQDSHSMNELLYRWERVCVDACDFGGGHAISDALADDGKSKRNAQEVFRDAKSKMEKAIRCEHADFLVAPLISDALAKLLQVYPISIKDILDGESICLKNKLRRIRSLQTALKNNYGIARWKDVSERILELLRQFSPQVAIEDLSDLSKISHILLDAFLVPIRSAYKTGTHGSVKKWVAGKPSCEKPIFLWNIPQCDSETEACELFSKLKAESIIALVLINETMEDQLDPLYNWATGREEELKKNWRRNAESCDKEYYRQYYVFLVKCGENVWTIGAGLYGKVNQFEFGRRATYLPYQAISSCDNKPMTSLTAYGVDGWDVRKILDKEQAIWMMAAVIAIEKAFFESVQEDEELKVQGHSVVVSNAPNTAGMIQKESNTLTLDCLRHEFEYPDVMVVPEGIESNPLNKELLAFFGVTAGDIADAPINIPKACMKDAKNISGELWKRARYALAVITERRFEEYFSAHERKNRGWSCHQEEDMLEFSNHYKQKCGENIENILAQLGDETSRIKKISEMTINNREVEIMRNGVKNTIVERTTIDHGRAEYNRPFFAFPETLAGKRPPVAILITPESPDDLSLLMGVALKELPWPLRVWKQWRAYNIRLNDPVGAKDPMDYIHNPFIHMDFSVKIAMSRSEFKSRKL